MDKLENYEIKKKLGVGAFGVVYKAFDPKKKYECCYKN